MHDEYLKREFNATLNRNIIYVFEDIVDDKHMKYMNRYQTDEVFWGIGIENESYFMLGEKRDVSTFATLKHRSERYSVDYYNNFKSTSLNPTLEKAATLPSLTYPVYINAHTFQKTNMVGSHRTLYDKEGTVNPAFTESIHDVVMRESPAFRALYDESVVYDGDSIEFITQRFYKGTVQDCVAEWMHIKEETLRALSPFFLKKGALQYPDHNYGFVSFLTTWEKNLGICNTGTVHVNLTLPTQLRNGCIENKDAFAKAHLNLIECIQMVEPLLIACYGTPDILALIEPMAGYSLGSLRVTRSRYISLQTFDTKAPVNGKLLLMDKPTDPAFWYNRLKNSPYYLNPSIGYDVNFNKFKNHGIELRFFDWFPEDLWPAVLNLFVLLAQHSMTREFTIHKERYNNIIVACVIKGFTARLSDANVILEELGLPFMQSKEHVSPLAVLQYIADTLYEWYRDGDIVQQMSPGMTRPILVDYNRTAFQALWADLYGRGTLIMRAEGNPLESRAPIAPCHVSSLLSTYNVLVESSTSRCFSDDDYRNAGATIVPAGFWIGFNAANAVVVGLKELSGRALSTQTHLYFAHCFKGQKDSKRILTQLEGSTLVDYEFMTNDAGERVLSFCAASGKVGAYLALMAYCVRMTNSSVLPAFNEDIYNMGIETVLDSLDSKPRVLLIGYGTAGRRAKQVLDQFGLMTTVWTSKTIPSVSAIRSHEILIHAIRLPDDPSRSVAPFLKPSDLNGWRGRGDLTVVCDISCDWGNPRNTLPLSEYTTPLEPIRRLESGVDWIAIPHLPSLEPEVSSLEFSSVLVNYLPDVRWMHAVVDEKTATLQRSHAAFVKANRLVMAS